MKGYQKLTIITAILGLIIPFIGLFLYFLINSVVGIPILALFVGWALLIAIAIIAINVGAIVAAFKVKNNKIVGGILDSMWGNAFCTYSMVRSTGLGIIYYCRDNGLKRKEPT